MTTGLKRLYISRKISLMISQVLRLKAPDMTPKQERRPETGPSLDSSCEFESTGHLYLW